MFLCWRIFGEYQFYEIQQGIAFFPLVAESLGGWHKVLKERSGNLGVRLLGTLGNWRVKPFPISTCRLDPAQWS